MGYAGITIPEGNVVKITAGGVVLWEKVTGRIPKEYQEVGYIYIPLGAYINTQWVPSNGARFNLKFKQLKGYPFGSGSNPRLAAAQETTENIQVYNPNNSANGIYLLNDVLNKVIEIETYTSAEYCSLTKDGNTTTKKQDHGYEWDTSLPMLLGAWQYSTSTIRQGEINLYYAKANVAGADIFELIPCYRKSDGVIGMYDLISKTFFTNAGSGSFTKGADV